MATVTFFAALPWRASAWYTNASEIGIKDNNFFLGVNMLGTCIL